MLVSFLKGATGGPTLCIVARRRHHDVCAWSSFLGDAVSRAAFGASQSRRDLRHQQSCDAKGNRLQDGVVQPAHYTVRECEEPGRHSGELGCDVSPSAPINPPEDHEGDDRCWTGDYNSCLASQGPLNARRGGATEYRHAGGRDDDQDAGRPLAANTQSPLGCNWSLMAYVVAASLRNRTTSLRSWNAPERPS